MPDHAAEPLSHFRDTPSECLSRFSPLRQDAAADDAAELAELRHFLRRLSSR